MSVVWSEVAATIGGGGEAMLITITTTHRPATDLGFVLRKHPDNVRTVDLPFGTAHVFWPAATAERATVALLIEVDPQWLSRRARGSSRPLQPYVNDRPFVASSFTSVALRRVYGSAMGGPKPSDAGEEDGWAGLARTPIPLEVEISAVRAIGGTSLAGRVFGPLGYEVDVSALDDTHSSQSNHAVSVSPDLATQGSTAAEESTVDGPMIFGLRLTGTQTVADLLNHLYVLLPVLDDDKHYWVGPDEIDKLLQHGAGWLSAHPDRELIAKRYLGHRRGLVGVALAGLDEGRDLDDLDADEAAEVVRPPSLSSRRHDAVLDEVQQCGARSAIDLGCGPGALLKKLMEQRSLTRVVGVDVSHRTLERAVERMKLDNLTESQRQRFEVFQGALTYRDARFRNFDVAILMEVIEHLDFSRLVALEEVVFGDAKPDTVLVTTPNVEHNVRFPGLAAGAFRHADHRFEWTRSEFAEWADAVAGRRGYDVRYRSIGDDDLEVGPPTQMAIFTLQVPGAVRETTTDGEAA